MCFFSINIPAHNCEDTILNALQSIAVQTFKDWEVVVYNDGSCDGTRLVCENQSVIPETKFTLLNGENVGPWEARKRLLSASKGEYIISIDSDDAFIGHDAFERIYSCIMRANCDVLLFNATRDLNSYEKFIDYSELSSSGENEIKVEDALKFMYESYALNNIWAKAYRRTIMDFGEDFDSSFLVNVEDRLQCFLLLSAANSCFLYDEILYYYQLNESSTTRSSFRWLLVDNMFEVEAYLNDHSQEIQFDELAHDRMMAFRFIRMVRRAYESNMRRKERWRLYREANSKLHSSIFVSAIGYDGGLPLRWDIMVKLFLSEHYALFDILSVVRDRFRR